MGEALIVMFLTLNLPSSLMKHHQKKVLVLLTVLFFVYHFSLFY